MQLSALLYLQMIQAQWQKVRCEVFRIRIPYVLVMMMMVVLVMLMVVVMC